MRIPKPNPRAEFRLQQKIRVNNAATLAAKFPQLKSLMVQLFYFDRGGLTKTGEVRYKVNVANAKSVLSFTCPHGECAQGDFDLSEAVEAAIENRKKTVDGELRCAGTRVRFKGDKIPCGNLLRYKLNLGYV